MENQHPQAKSSPPPSPVPIKLDHHNNKKVLQARLTEEAKTEATDSKPPPGVDSSFRQAESSPSPSPVLVKLDHNMADLDCEQTNVEADQQLLVLSAPAEGSSLDEQQHSVNSLIVPLSPPIRLSSLLEYPGYSSDDATFDNAKSLVAADSLFRGGFSNIARSSGRARRSPRRCKMPCFKRHSHFMRTPRLRRKDRTLS